MKKFLLAAFLCFGLFFSASAWAACDDGVKDGDEVGVDCGGSCTDSCFAATFNTTTVNETITLPLVNGYTYDFYVDWGDGTQDHITAYDQAESVHEYATADNYQINISGSFPYWNFYQTTAAPKLVSVDAQGDVGFGVGVTDFSRMYQGCSSLTDVSALSLPSGENFLAMFSQCTSLESVDLTDVSSGQNFGSMFYGNTSLSSVSTLYTPVGTNFDSMFYNCSSLTSIDMTDVSNGIYFGKMFRGATNLSSVTTMNTPLGDKFNHMFYQCPNLPNVPLSNLDSGTDFSQMFNGCSSLTSVSGLSTPSGENFYGMFANTGLLTADLTDVSNGTNFGGMFTGASNLLTVEPMSTPLGQSFLAMFDGCSALQSFSLTDVGDGTDFTRFVDGATSLVSGVPAGAKYNLDYSDTALPYAALQALFAGLGTADNSGGQQVLDITGNPGVTSLTAADYAVVEAKDWVVIPAYTPTCTDGVKNGDEVGVDCGGTCTDTCFAATFRTSAASESITLPLVSTEAYAFYVDWGDGTQDYISAPEQAERTHTYATAGDYQVNISGSMPFWSFAQVPDSRSQIITLDEPGDVGFGVNPAAFRYCNFMTSANLPDTSTVTNFAYLFEGCTSLQTVSGLDTSQGTNFLSMFKDCRNLTDPGTINLANAVDLRNMFQYATSLTSFNLDAPNGEQFDGMFLGATGLTNVTVGDVSKGTSFRRTFDACSGLQTISDLNIPLATDVIDMFRSCTSLTAVSLLDVSSALSFYRTFENNRSLSASIATGARYSINYSDSRLTTTSIRDLFDSVGIADNSVSQQILNITDNPGQTELTPVDYAVVEAKGWLVVPDYVPTCSDGIQNGDETGVDCGGSCGSCEVSGTCANLSTAYFEKFFYHDNPQIQAITTALNDYQYYDCDNKIFRIGNESNQMEDISMMLALRLTTAELNTMNTNKTATYKQSYYDTEAKVFRRGLEDGSLETVNEDARNLTAAEISAVTTASEGEFYYNITTRMFYIGESDGTLSQLFVQN